MKTCKDYNKKPIAVVPFGLGHWYICENYAKKYEDDGWELDYENWRLDD